MVLNSGRNPHNSQAFLAERMKRLVLPDARVLMIAGGLIIGFTVVSAFSATRVYLSEQFPTALRGRGHLFVESCGKLFAGGLVPFLMAPHTGSPTIFFGTMLLFAAIGAVVPIVWGKETTGQIEVIASEPAMEPARDRFRPPPLFDGCVTLRHQWERLARADASAITTGFETP
jgi:hypothetical protein